MNILAVILLDRLVILHGIFVRIYQCMPGTNTAPKLRTVEYGKMH